jgi:hypothetical protein
MKKLVAGAAAIFILVGLSLQGELPKESRDRALKVIAALEKLEGEQGRPSSRSGSSYTVSEADLNAWIAYRISTEMEKFVRSCELRLQAGNRAEGKLVIDLGGSPAAAFLPSPIDFFFSATAETRDGKIRITMESLFLGAQRLSPAFIDTVIGIVSGLEGQPATSLHDWYPLPYGIRRLESQPGRLVCHYQ